MASVSASVSQQVLGCDIWVRGGAVRQAVPSVRIIRDPVGSHRQVPFSPLLLHLIAPTGTSGDAHVRRSSHTLKVRVNPVQQLLPNAAVPPATKAAMGVLPLGLQE